MARKKLSEFRLDARRTIIDPGNPGGDVG